MGEPITFMDEPIKVYGILCATGARFVAHLSSYQCSLLLTTRLSCPKGDLPKFYAVPSPQWAVVPIHMADFRPYCI